MIVRDLVSILQGKRPETRVAALSQAFMSVMMQSFSRRRIACACGSRAILQYLSSAGGAREEALRGRMSRQEKVERVSTMRKEQEFTGPRGCDDSSEDRSMGSVRGTRGRRVMGANMDRERIVQLEQLYREGKAEDAMALMDAAYLVNDPLSRNCYRTALLTMRDAGAPERALILLERMEQQGLAPDAHTFNYVLGACARAGGVTEAEVVCKKMRAAGVPPTTAAVINVVGTYAEAGRLEEAHKYLGGLKEEGMQVHPKMYEHLLLKQVRTGKGAEAIQLLKEVADGPLGPHADLYSSVLREACLHRDRQTAWAAWADMRSRGQGLLLSPAALKDFMMCLHGHKNWARVLKVYDYHLDILVPAHPFILRTALNAATKLRDWPRVLQLATELVDRDLPLKLQQLKHALQACEALGDREACSRFLGLQKGMKEALKPSQHVMALLQQDKWDDAKAMVDSWDAEKLPASLLFSMAVAAARGQRLEEMWQALEEMERRGEERVEDLGLVYLPVMLHLWESGQLEAASRVLNKVKKRDDLQADELTAACADLRGVLGSSSQSDMALTLLPDLQDLARRPPSFLSRQVTRPMESRVEGNQRIDGGRRLTAAELVKQRVAQLEDFHKKGQFEDTMALMDAVYRADNILSKHCYNTALLTMCVAGQWKGALVLLGRMKEQADIHSYNCVLGACARAGRVAEAEMVFGEMQAAGVQPGIVSLNYMSRTYVISGVLEQARMFSDRVRDAVIQLDAKSYRDTLVGMLKAGQAAEALKLLEEIAEGPLGPQVKLYGSVLHMSSKMGDWQTAFAVWTDMRSRGDEIVPSKEAVAEFMRCATDRRHWPRVLEAYEFHLSHWRANSFIVRTALNAAANLSDWPRLLQLATEMVDRGFPLKTFYLKRALKARLVLGDKGALDMFLASQDSMDDALKHTQHVMALLELDRWDEAQELMDEWRPEQVPAAVVFSVAVAAAKGQRLPQMWTALEELEKRAKVRVEGMGSVYLPVIRGLTASAELEAASALLDKIKHRDDLNERELSIASAYIEHASGKSHPSEVPLELLHHNNDGGHPASTPASGLNTGFMDSTTTGKEAVMYADGLLPRNEVIVMEGQEQRDDGVGAVLIVEEPTQRAL